MDIDRRMLLGFGAMTTLSGCGTLDFLSPTSTPAPAPGAAPAVSADELRLHNDWAYLSRYHEANIVLQGAPQSERRVVFYGDSITQAWPDADPAFFTGTGYVGRGISGQTTPQMLVRFRADVIALQPLAVHILAGINDIAQNTGPYDVESVQNNFAGMAELARLHGIRVMIASILPAADFPWRPGLAPPAKVHAMNDWLRSYCTQQKFTFVDYTPVLDDGQGGMKPGLAYDGVHPTKAGYALMEQVVTPVIQSVLAPHPASIKARKVARV